MMAATALLTARKTLRAKTRIDLRMAGGAEEKSEVLLSMLMVFSSF
jgi:hypothetical protein